jgi:mono/diheme cytochrome c family protein
MTKQKFSLLALGLALLASGSALFFASPATAATNADAVARGRYLVTVCGCNDCHTPFKMGERGPEPDMSRMLSGHPEGLRIDAPVSLGDGPWVWAGAVTNTAFSGPWGVSFAANLTPDEYSGIGIWTEDLFVKTIRTGKHWGTSRPIQPPMPWPMYRQMTDEDLKAVFSYLRTIPPVRNVVAPYAPPRGE